MNDIKTYSTHLLTLLLENKGLQAIVDYASEILHNPIAVGTTRLTVLYVSKNMPDFGPTSHPGVIPPDFSTEQDFIFYNEAAYYSETPVLTSPQYGGYQTLLSRLVVQGEIYGYISLFFCLTSYDSTMDEIFTLVKQVVEVALAKEISTNLNPISNTEQLFSKLLSNTNTDISSNADAVIRLGLNKQTSFAIAIYQMSDFSNANKPNAYIKEQLHCLTKATVSIFYDQYIVSLIQGSLRYLSIKGSTKEHILDFMNKYSICGGISYRLRQINDIQKGFSQAKLALDYAYTQHSHEIVPYDHVVVPDFIKNVIYKNHLDYDIPELIILKNYDAEHQTDYCKVLEIYAEHEKNVPLTASILGLSKSSIYRIIERIKHLTGLDLDRNEQLFSIYLGLKIKKYRL